MIDRPGRTKRKVKLAEVHTIYEQNASDIVAMLRQSADNIEKGDPAVRAMVAIAELEEGGIQLFGWGKIETTRALALLQVGLHQMARDQLSRWEGGDE